LLILSKGSSSLETANAKRIGQKDPGRRGREAWVNRRSVKGNRPFTLR